MNTKILTPRMQLLLTKLETPRSITDLSEELNVGYYTVRNEVKNLVDHGFATELPFRREKEKLYQTVWDNPEASEPHLVFSFMDRQMDARTIQQGFADSQAKEHARSVARIIAYLLVNSQHRVEMNTGSYPGEKLTRQGLIAIRNYFNAVSNLCDQLLAAPMWSEEPGMILKVLGTLPIDEDHLLAQEWITIVNENEASISQTRET